MKSLKFYLLVSALLVIYSIYNFFDTGLNYDGTSYQSEKGKVMFVAFIQIVFSIAHFFFVKFIDDNFNYLNKK